MSGSPYLARTELLLGAAAMDALDRARVLVVGVGGVGGWCAEALVRSGVRHLTLVDSDRVAPSNVNRQVMATPSTVGEPKVEALRRLLLALNPAAEIEARALRYEPGSDAIDFGAFDYVVDAIDSVDCKADLIRSVLAAPHTTLFSSLGAARKTDVFRIRRDAFRKVAGDGLARALRNRFKKDGAWPERPFTCVWSDEPPAENLGAPDVGEDARANGTVMHVTAAFGLALAGLVIERIRAEILPVQSADGNGRIAPLFLQRSSSRKDDEMAKTFKIGYMPLSKVNWTNDTLEAARENALKFLKSLPGVEVIGPDHMLTLEGEAIELLEQFEKDRPDLLITHFMTFSLGVVPPMFAQRLNVPVVLWSMKEPDPQGGRLQNNSFCAANMNAHHMYRLHIPYFHVHAEPGTQEAADKITKVVNTAKAMKALHEMRIGLIGGRVPGFYTSCVSEMLLRRCLGPEVKIITEHELFTCAQNLTADEVAKGFAIIDEDTKTHPTDGPRGDQKEKSARLIAAVMKMKDKFFVDTFAMRCWPEVILNEFYGIAVCSTLGHLTNHGYLTACEGDVYGAVMMRIGQILSNDLPFFCDMIVMEGDYGVAWHCGAAPCGLCKPGYQPELHCSATVEGGGVKGCTGEFPLKPGRVTLARLGETRDGDGFRMLVATGEGLDTDMFVRGTPLKIKFDAGCDALRDEVINNGWEHHYALMYGDHVDELRDLCRNLNIEMHLVK